MAASEDTANEDTTLMTKMTDLISASNVMLGTLTNDAQTAVSFARSMYETLERKAKEALEKSIREINDACRVQAECYKENVEELCQLIDRFNRSLKESVPETKPHEIRQGVINVVESVSSKLSSQNDKRLTFVPDQSFMHLVESLETIGEVAYTDKDEHSQPRMQPSSSFNEQNDTGLYSKQPDICRTLSADLGFDFTDLFQSYKQCRISTRTVEERSWSSSSVTVSEESEVNNCVCRHSNKATQSQTLTPETKILNTYTPVSAQRQDGIQLSFCSRDSVDLFCVKSDARPFKAKYIDKFESIEHRTPCVICDIQCLPDMRLIVLDHYHNSIQMFGSDFNLLSEETCEYPIGCCTVNTDFVVVSLRRTGQLALFRILESKLKLIRTIKIPCSYYLWQVTYKRERLFVVCDENDIHVMDVNGKEYFNVPSGVPTERGFIRNFDVSDDASHMYLCERQGLRCVTVQGEFKWLFRATDLPLVDRNPHGHVLEDVCFYKNTLFGTLWITSKILQINLDGTYLRTVVISDIDHPRALSILRDTVFVTQFLPSMKPQNKRMIKVFKLIECESDNSYL